MSNPEIPSFKNPKGGGTPPQGESQPKDAAPGAPEKKEEKKGSGVPLFSKPPTAAKIPLVGSTPAPGPSLKVRGLAGGPKTLLERLKQFQKKDLVFIASGMGVLFMAPLAEHFMMSPSQGKSLTGGFDDKTGGSPFGGGVGPQEVSTGLMAPGGLIGGSADVITPLNVRDPSALVMAPGASQVQPPPAATTVAPPAASSSRESGWKDALSGAAKAGVEKGVDAAKPGAFRAPGNLAGALRGLSALSGGSYGGGPSFNLDKPNASNVPNRSGEGGRLSQVKAAPGYRGVGARGLDGGGGAEALRKAGEGQGDRFNRPGGAAGNLESAAKEAIPVGGGTGGAGPGSGGENKGASGNNSKDNKALGESLAYLRMKMEMEKELDLKWSKKKWKEFEFPKMIYEEITKSAIQNIVGKGLFEPLGKKLASWNDPAGGKASGIYCTNDGRTQNYPNDPSVSYGCLGNSQGQSWNVKDGDRSGPPTNTFPCGNCTEYNGGDSKNPTGPQSGGSDLPEGAPGSENRRREEQRRRNELGGQTVATMNQNCASSPPTDADPQRKRYCAAANSLKDVYPKNLTEATQQDGRAEDHRKLAWRHMSDAAGKMKLAAENAVKQGKKLGCPGQRTGCDESNLLSLSEKLDAKLKEIEAEPTLTPTVPPQENPRVGQLYNEALELVNQAKTAFGDPVWGVDQRSDILKSLNLANTELLNASREAKAGGVNIKTAESVIKAVREKPSPEMSWGGDDLEPFDRNFVRPIENNMIEIRGNLRIRAGRMGETGEGGDIATEGSIGAANQSLTRTVEEIKGFTCGDCKNSGIIRPGGDRNNLMLATIDAQYAGRPLVFKGNGQEPLLPPPGDSREMKEAAKQVQARQAERIGAFKNSLKAFDEALAVMENGGEAKGVNGLVTCTAAKGCGGGSQPTGGVTGAAARNVVGEGLFEPLGGQISGAVDHPEH